MYNFNESELVEELKKYIYDTYGKHYATGNGQKEGYNRKDIMKILHYAIILLYVHDESIKFLRTGD